MSAEQKIPRIAVIWFPGMNCEEEAKRACETVGMRADIVRWNAARLDDFDGFVLPGGWSFEDRIRAGVIASKDPLFAQLRKQAQLGKPILGICNGCQVLVETGLVPGLGKGGEAQLSLAPNINPLVSGYYCAWIKVKFTGKRNAFTLLLDEEEILDMPIAHGEGRFVTADAKLLPLLRKEGLITFSYCDSGGNLDPSFPVNPNGSTANIAALSNTQGNVLAIMPHPERAMLRMHLKEKEMRGFEDAMSLAQCAKLFESMREYLKEERS